MTDILPAMKDRCPVVFQMVAGKGEERPLEMFPSEQR